jgi:hypothetical protein
VDARVTARVEDGTWIGTVRTVQADGGLSDPLLFVDITLSGPRLSAVLSPPELGLPESFDWISRAELGEQAYPFFPETGHRTSAP